jgi:DNA invertase Pin-like site-specific DNA recombinase
VFAEKKSGKSAKDRPQFQELLEYAREGDEIVVTKLDRWARSITDLMVRLKFLHKKGVRVTFLDNPELNLDTAQGELLLGILGAVSQFERRLIVSRTAERQARAKAKGVKFGPKPKVKVRALKKARKLSAGEIGKAVGLSRRTVYRILERL